MMHAKIFSGGSVEDRAKAIASELADAEVIPSDIIRLILDDEKERIGIAQVREFTKRMILGPTNSPYMVGIIEQAELLTTESQNALLKIIEEPPAHALFLLGTPTIGALLPTIISRCQEIVIRSTKEENSEAQHLVSQQLFEILDMTPGSMILKVGSIATDRIVSKQWILEAIRQIQRELKKEVSGARNINRMRQLSYACDFLIKAIEEISVNVTPKLAIECAFLNIKKSQII